jgi:hypothetical protein
MSILLRVNHPLARLLLLPGCLAVFILGCGEPPSASPVPATQPAAQAAPPSTAPLASSLLIDGQTDLFGPAMLRLTKTDNKIEARLYSNEPTGVLSGKETVDSYDFDMILPDISDPSQIGQAIWTFKSPSSQQEDSPYGIFLNQQKKVLQPMDVSVQFSGQAPDVRVIIQGMFWMFPTNQDSSLGAPVPTMVRVIGSLETSATVK